MKNKIEKEIEILENREDKPYDDKNDNIENVKNKLAKILRSDVKVEDLEHIMQELTPTDARTTKYRAHFERRQEKMEGEVKEYIQAHKKYIFIPFILSGIFFLATYCFMPNGKILSVTNALYNRRLLICCLYGTIAYLLGNIITFSMINEYINILDWIDLSWVWKKKYHDILGVNFYNSFEFSDPEKEGITIIELKNLLKKYYNFDVSYEECINFLEKEPGIAKYQKKRKKEVLYGIRFKYKNKKQN